MEMGVGLCFEIEPPGLRYARLHEPSSTYHTLRPSSRRASQSSSRRASRSSSSSPSSRWRISRGSSQDFQFENPPFDPNDGDNSLINPFKGRPRSLVPSYPASIAGRSVSSAIIDPFDESDGLKNAYSFYRPRFKWQRVSVHLGGRSTRSLYYAYRADNLGDPVLYLRVGDRRGRLLATASGISIQMNAMRHNESGWDPRRFKMDRLGPDRYQFKIDIEERGETQYFMWETMSVEESKQRLGCHSHSTRRNLKCFNRVSHQVVALFGSRPRGWHIFGGHKHGLRGTLIMTAEYSSQMWVRLLIMSILSTRRCF